MANRDVIEAADAVEHPAQQASARRRKPVRRLASDLLASSSLSAPFAAAMMLGVAMLAPVGARAQVVTGTEEALPIPANLGSSLITVNGMGISADASTVVVTYSGTFTYNGRDAPVDRALSLIHI